MTNFYMRNRPYILGMTVGVVIIYLFSSLVIEKRLHSMKVYLDSEIVSETKILSDLALTTGKGGSNEQADTVVSDCSHENRTKYESLLSSLDSGLAATDLKSLEVLFNSCGDVFSSRRSSMAMQLEREYKVLEQLSLQRNFLGDYDKKNSTLSKWKELVDNEIIISDHFRSLVKIQKQIIDAVISAKTIDSDEVVKLRTEAKEINDKMVLVTELSSVMRSALITP